MIAIVAPLHLFAQFWYHTRLIDRMGWLEHVITTPSHHRVHHAINDAYLDRNYGQVFILWDKWFGTFQEELQEEPPVYGVKIQPRTWNPILINVQHFWRLVKDAISTSSWADRAKLWFMPTGWRPADLEAQYPYDSIKDVHKQAKYSSPTWPLKKAWTWTQ